MIKKIILGVIVLFLAAGTLLIIEKNNKGSDIDNPIATNSAVLQTDSTVPLIKEENVSYFESAKGYFVRPKAEGVYPGVIMIHENRGLRPEIKETAEQLAKEGYLVLAVDLYEGTVLETQEEARSFSGSFDNENDLRNLQAGVEYLRSQGATKIASLGWCFGGRQSVALATSDENLEAVIVYYGSNMASKKEELQTIKAPVLGIFGDQDTVLPLEKVREFETSLDELGIKNEIYIYEGVGHAFANPSGPNYAPNETKDAWIKTLTFLKKYLQN